MSEFLAIGIVGAGASVGIQWLKKKYGLDSLKAKFTAIGVSVLVGALYFFVSPLDIWESILGVLAAASTMYAFVYSGK